MTLDEQVAYLTKGCVDVVREAELRAKLARSAAESTPLTVKVGFDPTAPDLHLGHTVLIRKMKHFQDLGHRVVFLIGDFTGLIGDPTGRSKTRPPLSREQIRENAETYKAQIFKLLDPDRTVVDFNSGLAGRPRERGLDPARGLLQRRADARAAALSPALRRRPADLDPRVPVPAGPGLRLGPPAGDVELGGTDQLFNLNVGRDIMPAWDVEAQVVMTTPLLVGLDGAEKMSKTAGNYVGINEAPNEMFGKLMSMSDALMWEYYKLLTDLSLAEIGALAARTAVGRGASQAGQGRPRDAHRHGLSLGRRGPRRGRSLRAPVCPAGAADGGGRVRRRGDRRRAPPLVHHGRGGPGAVEWRCRARHRAGRRQGRRGARRRPIPHGDGGPAAVHPAGRTPRPAHSGGAAGGRDKNPAAP